jgi:hypothetical protein
MFLLLQVVPGLSSLTLLTLLNLFFFAFFGLVLFHDVKGAEHFFGSFGKAIWQLGVLQTTSNCPDVRHLQLPVACSAFHVLVPRSCVACESITVQI